MGGLSGSVGHHDRKGCRLLCGFLGQNKIQGSHYYLALLRPNGFSGNPTSGHPYIDVNTLPAPDPEAYKQDLYHFTTSTSRCEYERHCYNTGIGKPSIFAGVPRILSLPMCFPGDLMHQLLINLAALLDLWCAQPEARSYDPLSDWPWAVLTGDTWVEHGKVVGRAARYLPTSFGRTP